MCSYPLLQPIDYETTRTFTLSVVAENESPLPRSVYPPRASTATVSIRVLDVNEGPQFDPNPKTIRLEEGIQAGTTIQPYLAHDPDRYMRQSIRYTHVHYTHTWYTLRQTNTQTHTNLHTHGAEYT